MKTILVALQTFFKNLRVDDILHFLSCYAIALTFGMIHIVLGVVLALAAGILKEVYDYNHPDKHTYSGRDIFWDFGGIVAAFFVLVLRFYI